MQRIGIIDCGMGNLTSVKNAFSLAGAECHLVTNASEIKSFDKIILPGVGAFPFMMRKLQEGSFIGLILQHINNDKPFMGICLGMQVLFDCSVEFGNTKGLSVLKGNVVELPQGKYPIPNVGWWDMSGDYSAFSSALTGNDTFYFVHSFYCKPEASYDSLFIKINGVYALVAVRYKNVFGYQFHPEKSQNSGQKLLKSFMDL